VVFSELVEFHAGETDTVCAKGFVMAVRTRDSLIPIAGKRMP